MNDRQKLFCDEYLKDMNATQAAIRAGYSEKTAYSSGQRLLKDVEVQRYLAERQADARERNEIDQDWVIDKWKKIVEADPNELMQLRRTCCRHCHGADHEYQWRTEAEWEKACEAAQKLEKPKVVSNAGGYGFDKKLDPVASCTNCDGEGVVDVHALDTRKLSPSAQMLFAGVKMTQHGIEIKTHDKAKALESLARNLGMFKDVSVIEVTDDAIAALKAARKSATE